MSGVTASTPFSKSLSLDAKTPMAGVSTLWARRKIRALEDERFSGGQVEQHDRIREAITEVALEHHLVSRFTSLVAVETWQERPPGESLSQTRVPNLVAQGQRFHLPRTATDGRMNLLIGSVALLLGLLIARARRLS